jgi:hypothetical protein
LNLDLNIDMLGDTREIGALSDFVISTGDTLDSISDANVVQGPTTADDGIIPGLLILPNSFMFQEIVRDITKRSVRGVSLTSWPSAETVTEQLICNKSVVLTDLEKAQLRDTVYFAQSFVDETANLLGLGVPRVTDNSLESFHMFQIAAVPIDSSSPLPSSSNDLGAPDNMNMEDGAMSSDYELMPEDDDDEATDSANERDLLGESTNNNTSK